MWSTALVWTLVITCKRNRILEWKNLQGARMRQSLPITLTQIILHKSPKHVVTSLRCSFHLKLSEQRFFFFFYEALLCYWAEFYQERGQEEREKPTSCDGTTELNRSWHLTHNLRPSVMRDNDHICPIKTTEIQGVRSKETWIIFFHQFQFQNHLIMHQLLTTNATGDLIAKESNLFQWCILFALETRWWQSQIDIVDSAARHNHLTGKDWWRHIRRFLAANHSSDLLPVNHPRPIVCPAAGVQAPPPQLLSKG